MFRQFKDDDSENIDVNKTELLIESSGESVLLPVSEAVPDPGAKNRKPKKRGRKKKGNKPASDNSKQERIIIAGAPIIISDVTEGLAHLPRERLSSCSSLSSKSDSDEENNTDVKRTYYFTSRDDSDAYSDADVNINIERKNGELGGNNDIVTNTSEEEEEEEEVDEEMGKEEAVEEGAAEECVESAIPVAREGSTPLVADDDSSSRCSTDTESGHPDGQHFSTVFVVNSSSDGEESGAEDVPVCLTKIKIISEDDLLTVTEIRSVGETVDQDTHVKSCLDTPDDGSVACAETEIVGVVLLSHNVCQEGIPAVSEQTVHESESVELKHVTESVTAPLDEMVETIFNNETDISKSDVELGKNGSRSTFINGTVPEHLITDMIASDREEGDEQSLRGEVNEGRNELHSVVVQKMEEGDTTDVTTYINESEYNDIIVAAENESDFHENSNDTEEKIELLKY
ncbi:hypothetical protein B7P43_G04500, partial [Cryptotermes secundus]